MKEKEWEPGDKIDTWFSDQPDGLSTVFAVYPYKGKYDFRYTLEVSAPRTRKGRMLLAVE